MATEPITGLTYQEAGSLQTDVLQNAELNYFAAWVNPVVLTVGYTSPPVSPNDGDRYIVGNSASGDWAGHDSEMAVYRGGWQFFASIEGVSVRKLSDGKRYIYDGANWNEESGGGIEVITTISSGTITPTGTTDIVRPAALSAALTIANPSSTPADGAGFVVDLIDDGTTRALTWGSKYASRMATLPTTTTVSKRHRIGFEYNATDDKLYCMYAQVQS